MKPRKPYDGSRRSDFHRYRQWQFEDESNYRGLSEKDLEYLRKFNREYLDENFRDNPLHKNRKEQRALYKACYKQRNDLQNIAGAGVDSASYDIREVIVESIDSNTAIYVESYWKSLGGTKGVRMGKKKVKLVEIVETPSAPAALASEELLTRQRILKNVAAMIDAVEMKGFNNARALVEAGAFIEQEIAAVTAKIGEVAPVAK